MEQLRSLYNNRLLGLSLVSALLVLEHLQAMSFIQRAPAYDAEEWTDGAKDWFDFLDALAIEVEDKTYTVMFVVYGVIISLGLLAYVLLGERIHTFNKQESLTGMTLCAVDYLVFGVLYVPMLGTLTATQYCDNYDDLIIAPDVDCWGSGHMIALQISFLLVGLLVVLAAGILPVLKTERKGVESRWANESYFAGVYKLQLAVLVLFTCPIRIPAIGLVISLVLAVYVAVCECYTEIHIASLKLGLLCGQAWAFACALTTEDNGEAGSLMWLGWLPAILLGYGVLHAKKLFIARTPKELVIEKQY